MAVAQSAAKGVVSAKILRGVFAKKIFVHGVYTRDG